MKKSLLLFLLLNTAVLGFATGQKESTINEVNISYVKSPFNLPLIVGKEKGFFNDEFQKRGVQVNFHEITSGAKQAQAMAAGSLDFGGVMNTTSVILANSGGNRIDIISGFSKPEDMFAIVTKESFSSLKDLKGKKIAGPKGTVLHQMLVAVLNSQGLTIDDIEFFHMGLPQARTAMLSGEVDGALLAASLVIKSVEAGAHVLTTSKGYVVPKLVITAREDITRDNPELVEAYRVVDARATKWIADNFEEAIEIGATEQGISIEDAKLLYKWSNFNSQITPEDIESMEEDIQFMIANDMIADTIDPREFIYE